MGMRLSENAVFYLFTVFVLAYGEETLELGKSTMLLGVAIAAAIGLFTVPLWGSLSDRSGRRKVYMAGAVFSMVFAFPFFALVDTKEPILIYLAIVLGVNVGHDLMYGPQAAYYAELFGTRVRYSGASLGYQLASVFSGGFAALIATALLATNDDSPTLVALYISALGVITVIATALAPETYHEEIEEARPEERRFFREGTAQRTRPARARRSAADLVAAAGARRRASRRRLTPHAVEHVAHLAGGLADPLEVLGPLLLGHLDAAAGERVGEALDDRQRGPQRVDE